MPSKKSRVVVLLDDDQFQVVSDLAQLRGVSRASILRELYEASEETLLNVIRVLRAAKKAESDYVSVIKQDMEEVDLQIRPLIEQVIEVFARVSEKTDRDVH